MGNDEMKQAYAEQLGLHPIAVEASSRAQCTDGGVVFFDDETLQSLCAQLEALSGSEELPHAVLALVKVAGNLKFQMNQPTAGDQLMAVAESATMALQEGNASRAQDIQLSADDTLRKLSKLRGEQRVRRAPKMDAIAPAGSIPIGMLQPRMFR